MKQLSTFLSNPIGNDDFGTSSLTGFEMIIAVALVLATFAYLAFKASHDHTTK